MTVLLPEGSGAADAQPSAWEGVIKEAAGGEATVTIPSFSTTRTYGPARYVAPAGKPAPGAPCTVVFTDGQPLVVVHGTAIDLGFFDPHEEGAVGDGTHDDWEAIMNTAANGGVVTLHPTKTYLITQTLVFPSRTTVRGYGGAIIKGAPSMAGTALMVASNFALASTDILLDGVELDGNRSNRSAGAGPAVEFRGLPSGARTKRVYVRNYYLHDSPGPGIAAQNVEQWEVTDGVTDNCGRDAILGQANVRHVLIAHHEISRCSDDAVGIHSGPQSANQSMDVTVTDIDANGDGVQMVNGLALNGILRANFDQINVYRPYAAGLLISNHDGFPCENVKGKIKITEPGAIANAEGNGLRIGVYPSNGYYGENGEAVVRDVEVDAEVIRPYRHALYIEGRSSASGLKYLTVRCRFIGAAAGAAAANDVAGVRTIDQYIEDLTLDVDVIRDFQGRGVFLEHAIKRPTISGPGRIMNNGQGNGGGGVFLGASTDARVERIRATDTQATKTQGVGVNMGTSTGAEIIDNDLSGNVGAGISGTRHSSHYYRNNKGDTPVSLASAATIGVLGPVMSLTGATNVTSITAGRMEQRVLLIVPTGVTIVKGGNLKLTADFVGPGALSLICDGTDWYENRGG